MRRNVMLMGVGALALGVCLLWWYTSAMQRSAGDASQMLNHEEQASSSMTEGLNKIDDSQLNGLDHTSVTQEQSEEQNQNDTSSVSPSPQGAPVTPTSSTASSHTLGSAQGDTIDVHAIPLGDGKVSTSPRVGYVYSCDTSFRGGGAEHAGDWIQGTTWDLTKKISVQGSVSWSSATFSATTNGLYRILTGNGLPVGSVTGIFPIRSTDPAYQYDRNPNSITSLNLSLQLPISPTFAATPACVPMGPIGYALNGVAIYNALDDAGRDAVAHEVQDACEGHPQMAGQYHYHGPSDCMPHANEHAAQVGYALDGFGIYSRFDVDGREYTNADLDACHGTTSAIVWNGAKTVMYHYVLTEEYPYTVGCFRGTPVHGAKLNAAGANNTTTPQGGGGGTPPAEAVAVCAGKAEGASCTVGPGSGTCRTTPDGSFACVPTH